MEHDCTRSGEFEKLEIVYKEVMGNGKEGLSKTSVRLQESVSALIPVVDCMRTTVSGIEKTIVAIQTIARENERHSVNRRWYIGTLITLSGISVAAIITLLTT